MFKPILLDNSDYCNVLKHSLSDDLLPFSLDSNNQLNYDSGPVGNLTSKYNILSSLASNSSLLDVWQPIFINNDTNINTKLLSSYGSYHNSNPNLKSCRLGIENFYNFTGNFKSFSNTANMSIDWIINSSNIPYYLCHGILCWYRYNNFSDNPNIMDGKLQTIDKFPNGSRLTPSTDTDKIYIKLNDNKLYDISNPSKIFQNNSWTFNAEANTSIVDVPSNVTFKLAHKEKDTDTTTKDNNLNPTFWIPDGDCFFYYDNTEDVTLSSTNNIPPKSYISSALYKSYNLIYRIITLDEERNIKPKNLRKSRLYRSLAHALSTSPFITDFTIKALDTTPIRNLIQQYVNTAVFPNAAASQALLNTLLINISTQLQKTISSVPNDSLYLDTKFTKNTIHNNIIRNKNDLFYKLFQKYGTYANITTDTTFTVKTDKLKVDNRAISIFQNIEYYCNKALSGQIDPFNSLTLYNNQTITFDNTVISTVFDTRQNLINITNTNDTSLLKEIPLYNTARPSFNADNFSSVFKPYISYTGYVQREYRADNMEYKPEVQGNMALNNEDNIYYAQVDLNAQTKLSADPYAAHISNLYNDGEDGSPPPQSRAFEGIVGIRNNLNNDNGIELIAIILNAIDRAVGNDTGTPRSDVVGLPDSYLEQSISFVWEQVGGRTGYFGTKIQGTDYRSATGFGYLTQFYPEYTGKYTIKCTASTPFGSFTKYKTFYVVDGKNLNNAAQYGKYWDPISKSWTDPVAINQWSTPLVIDKDNILCNTIKFNKIVINNIAGVFLPIQTNCVVRRSLGNLGRGTTMVSVIKNMGPECIFDFENSFVLRNNPVLSIQYKPNNTTGKLYSIYLERIRTDDPKCSQCLSMYYPKITVQKSNKYLEGGAVDKSRVITLRQNKYAGGDGAEASFDLEKYVYRPEWNGYKSIDTTNEGKLNFYIYPQVSTKFAPPIKNYGGYSRSFLDSIGIDVIGLTKPSANTALPNVPSPIVSNNPTVLPHVTGYPLNQPNIICMQKAIQLDGSGLKMPFIKGIFHPASGWISHSSNLYPANANKSSVLKFNPGGRNSFSFVGPKIDRLKSNQSDLATNQIMPKIFSSTISLSISDGVRWECCAGTDSANQLHKNYSDIDLHNFNNNHGYRILDKGQPKDVELKGSNNNPVVNDEFEYISEIDISYYKFAVTGPFSSVVGSKNKRIPKINNLSIKDIEVKLNFLNYVNTKNLIVWLDVEYDPKEKATRAEATDSPLILRSKDFINQTINQNVFFGDYTYNQSKINILANSELNDYLKNLLNFNSVSGLDNSNFKLVLLNQETLYNNGYNFSIKFSDHASKHNSPYEIVNSQNYYSAASGSEYSYLLDPIRSKQTICQNNHEVLPTTAATGFSDRQACYHSSTIKLNNLNISNNTFNKFVSDSLFRNTPTSSCVSGSLDGETKFRLNIMVLDEEDDMAPRDNTINAQYLSEFETVKNISKSSLISNSLCSWELILHTEKERDFVPETKPSLTSYGNSDVLSLIDYKKGLIYNGHSFIADLTAYKHLLPLANYNAPYCCISDENMCSSPDNDPTGSMTMARPPEFPSWAILAIMTSLAAAGAMGGMGAVGVLTGIAGINNDAAYHAIVAYLVESSYQQSLQNEARNTWMPDYKKYPFGSSEKILLNFKTPTSLWHTAEASIFKYHNTPILKNNQYKFIRLSRHNDFGKFEYKKITSYKELIDPKFIKNISGVSDGTVLNPPNSYNNTVVNSGDILYDIANSGLYLAGQTAALITNANNTNNKFENINKANLYLSQNAVLSFGSSTQQFWHNDIINVDISGNKMIVMSGRMPYDIFGYNDSIILMSGTTTLSNTIAKKALILQNNTYNSVFVMSSPIQSGYDIMCPNDNDTIFLTYKNETTVQDKVKNKYNIWGLNNTSKTINDTIDLQSTCNSIGSYGDASIFLEKNVLSNNVRSNKLKNISEILNNHENDKIKHAKITLFQPSGTGTINESITNLTPSPAWFASKTYGYSYSKDEFVKALLYRTEKLNREVVIIASGEKEQAIFENLNLSSAYNDMPKNISIIRTYYNQTLPTGIQNGILEVEGDYYNHIPIRSITSDELTKLTDRLNLIQNTGIQTSLESIVGKPDQTATTNILASDRLKYIVQHYNSLPADSGSCDSRTSTSFINCHKKNTLNKMEQLYQEEYDIADLIRNQTVLLNNVLTLRSSLPDAHPLKINNDILPKYGPVISDTSGPISIEYKKLNENHYWINLDPNQGCFPDYEANPKVLVKTVYKCVVANYGLLQARNGNDNVCNAQAPSDIQGENMTFKNGGPTNEGQEYTYTVDETFINQEINRIQVEYGSTISSWREITRERTFNINGDQTFHRNGFTDALPNEEITIIAKETYKVPVQNYTPAAETIDTATLPGMPPCNGSNGSLGGIGLLQDNSRTGKPITIAATVNLSDQNNISVMVKKIPRILRNTDRLTTVYRPGVMDNYRQVGGLPFVPEEFSLGDGPLTNSFYVWYALNIQNNQLQYAPLPDFFKLQNEMIFRSFFGSVDRIENKTDSIVPGFPWELIPFEYDSRL
jgi:hypothetical protein